MAFHTNTEMPTKDRFDPRSFFGFTGSPLPVPDGNAPTAIADRFKRHGQEAFLPYVDPYATLAQGQQYSRAGHELEIQDAENTFLENLDNFSENPSGLAEFLQKHPQATFSPMVQTWRKMHATAKDPYEAMVAREGADYLQAYRAAVDGGQEPMEAFAEFRDVVKKEGDSQKKVQDDELFFVEKGGDIEDFETLQTKGATRGQMLDFIHKKGKAPTTTEVSKYSKLKAELDDAERGIAAFKDMEEDEYKTTITEALGKEPATKEDWDAGYMILKEKKIGPKRQALEEYEAGLIEQGKRIPGKANVPQSAPALAPIAPATAKPAAPPVTVAPSNPGMRPLSQVRSMLKP